MKKPNYFLMLAGAAVAAGTLADLLPGDEIFGVPLGAALMAKGAGII